MLSNHNFVAFHCIMDINYCHITDSRTPILGRVFSCAKKCFDSTFFQKCHFCISSELTNNEYNSPCLCCNTFTGKEKDSETGFYYFGARYYDPTLSGLFLSVDPMAGKYPSISPYAYCAWNPVRLVDVAGLYPRAILKYDANAFPHGGGYRLTSPATHLLSLVSGVKESYIANAIIVKRGLGHYVPFYSSRKGGGAITLGYSSNKSNIILTQNYFEDDASAYNNNGYGQNISEWLDILSHEVGHIPQIDKNGGMRGYVSNAVIEYIKSSGHDEAPSEKEADIGQTQYRRFNAFISSKYGENAISELLSSRCSDKQKVQTIDKWWNEYKKSCNETE